MAILLYFCLFLFISSCSYAIYIIMGSFYENYQNSKNDGWTLISWKNISPHKTNAKNLYAFDLELKFKNGFISRGGYEFPSGNRIHWTTHPIADRLIENYSRQISWGMLNHLEVKDEKTK